MDIVTYKIYRNNEVVYTNSCPLLFFMAAMPLVEYQYDYIECLYNNISTKLDYYDLNYKDSYGISKDKHDQLLNFIRESAN